MHRAVFSRRRRRRLDSFTLVELLVVVMIILILAALTLAAGGGVMNTAARNRAKAEIQAMSTALESYKTDNGAYPPSSTLMTNNYGSTDPTISYITGSTILYQALAGKLSFTGSGFSTVAPSVGKAYMTFKIDQLGNTTAGQNSYVEDPFGYAYGYNTGDTASPQVTPPYNGSGFFDLWSTGGALPSSSSTPGMWTNTWLSNWATQ